MTLSTNVYVLDPTDHREIFRFCQGLLTKWDEPNHRTPDQQEWSDEGEDPGVRFIANRIGQGLPAILKIKYRTDAPLRTVEQSAAHDEDCDADYDGHHHPRACWLDIVFDTAYGARFSGRRGCGDLHAALVSEVGQWCDARGVRWEWRNEYTGDVHGGADRYERLVDLVSGSFEAQAWFVTSVLPAIHQ